MCIRDSDHPTRGQYALETAADVGVVRRQDLALGGEQMEGEGVGIVSQPLQLAAQAIVHRQGQLDTPRACADDGDGHWPRVLTDPLEQGQPALVEAPDRLHRDRVLGRTGNTVDGWRGANVDRQAVVGQRRAMTAAYLALLPIDPDDPVAIEAGTGEGGQTRQVLSLIHI